MTRRFLAFLALLTGLVALGGPAQASLVEALACGSSIAANSGDETAGHERLAEHSVPVTLYESRALEAPHRAPAGTFALRLPVLMGVERALE